MVVFGKRNLKRLMESLIIPDVGVYVCSYWILPIYRVEITHNK